MNATHKQSPRAGSISVSSLSEGESEENSISATRPEPTREPRHWRYWLAAIVFLGAALRLYDLGERSMWYDEGGVLVISRYLSDPAKFFDPEYCNDAPLHEIVTAVWFAAVKALPGVEQGSRLGDALLRWYPCAAGIFGIWLAFVVCRRLTRNTTAALFGAFLFAISPFQIYYAQDLRAYPLHVVLNLAAVYCMIQALEHNKARYWIGLTLAMTTGIYNHFFMVWCIVAINLYFVLTIRRHWKLLLHWTASNLAVLVLAAPALRMALYISLVFDTAQEVWYEHPSPRFALITFKNFFAGYGASVAAYQALTLLAAAALAIGVWSLRRRIPALTLILVLAFAPIVLAILYWSTKDFPYYTHRLFIFSAVPCYWLVGHGLAALPSRAIKAAALAAFAVFTLPPLADYYAQRLHPSQTHTLGILYKPDNRGAAQYLAEHYDPETDLIVHRIRNTQMPFRYYLKDLPQPVVDLTDRQVLGAMIGYPSIRIYETGGLMPRRLDTVLEPDKRLWLVNSWWQPHSFEPGTIAIARWLDAHAIREVRAPFDGLSLYRYQLTDPSERDLRRQTVLDTGRERTPVYVDPSDPHVLPEPDYLQRTLGAALAEAGGVVLSFDTSSTEELAAPYVLQDGTATFTYRIENRSDRPRRLIVNVFSSADVIDPADFKPLDADSSVWRYGIQYPQTPAEPLPNRTALIALLTRQSPQGKTIGAPLNLTPGAYQVLARVKTAQSTVNHDGARAKFTIADGGRSTVARAVIPTFANLAGGWNWVPVGTAPIAARPVELRISAYLPDTLARAEFHLDRVRLIPANAAPTAQRETLEIGPQRTRVLNSMVPLLGGQATMRVDIETYEPATAEFRNLSFYVDRSSVNAGN